MTGQINRGSSLGDWIYNTSCQENIHTIVEIGTGSGQGSTGCVTDAIKNKPNCQFYSVESHKEHYDLAVHNVPKLLNVHLLYGYISDSVIDYTKMPGNLFRGYNHTQCKTWYERDISDYKNCQNVLHMIPDHIDLLILDGGPFTSWNEFLILKDRSKYIVLDDTVDIKNHDARQYILTNYAGYDIIIDDISDRNGYMIVRKLWE